MMRRMYDWMMGMAGSPRAPWALAVVSFIESSFFPIPPDVMLIPMVLSDRHEGVVVRDHRHRRLGARRPARLCHRLLLLRSDRQADPRTSTAGSTRSIAFIQFVHEYGVEAVIIKGMTPIPFKVVTIAAGVAKMDLLAFIGASIIARAMRFYLVAALLYFFGQPIREFIERRLTLVTTVFVVVLVSGFVAVKYLF